jgi:peptidoglycan/LPS O-acetylase OafA/YrhL
VAVLLGHADGINGYFMIGGSIAVQAFYILSGFFITMILNEKYVVGAHNGRFYLSRGLRIFVVYWTCLALTLVGSVFIFRLKHSGPIAIWDNHWKQLSVTSIAELIFSQIFLFGQDTILFLARTGDHFTFTTNFGASDPPLFRFMLLPQAWSLPIELSFYIIAPFIVRKSVWILSAVFGISLCARLVGAQFGLIGDPWSYRFFPFELAFFMAGALAYHLYKRVPKVSHFGIASFGIFAAAILYPLYGETTADTVFDPGRLIFLACVAIGIPALFAITGRSAIDHAVGELSFPFYLLHLLVLDGLKAWRSLFLEHHTLYVLIAIMTTVFVSAVIVRFVDLPINRLRHRLVPSDLPTGLGRTQSL